MPPVGDPPSRASFRKLILQWYAAHDRPVPGLRSRMPRLPIPTSGRTPRVPVPREPVPYTRRRNYS